MVVLNAHLYWKVEQGHSMSTTLIKLEVMAHIHDSLIWKFKEYLIITKYKRH